MISRQTEINCIFSKCHSDNQTTSHPRSRQDGAHGRLVPAEGGDPELPDAVRGGAVRHGGARHLLGDVAVHRRRQERAPEVGLDVRDQEGLVDRPTVFPSPPIRMP